MLAPARSSETCEKFSPPQPRFSAQRTCLLQTADGTHISCMMPDIAGIIRYMVRSSDPYRRLFLEMLEKHAGRLNLILYHDDIQGGNVLSPTPSKKATMVYFSFMEMHRAFLLSPAAWCVCGCLEYQQGQSLLGRLHGPSGGSDCVGLPAAF